MNQPQYYKVQQYEDAIPSVSELNRAVTTMERKLAARRDSNCRELEADKFAKRWAQAQANRNR